MELLNNIFVVLIVNFLLGGLAGTFFTLYLIRKQKRESNETPDKTDK